MIRRSALVAVAAVLCLGGRAVTADEKAPTPDQGADAVLAAFRAKDAAQLTRWAQTYDPDPWLVADALWARGETDAADALAHAASERALGKLVEYVASLRGKTDDAAAARKAVAAARAAFDDGRLAEGIALLDAAPAPSHGVIAAWSAATRGRILSRAGHVAEEERSFTRALEESERLGWPGGQARVWGVRCLAAFARGDSAAARSSAERAMAIHLARGSRLGYALVLALLGLGLANGGAPADAAEGVVLVERAQRIFEEIGDRAMAASLQSDARAMHALMSPTALGRLSEDVALAERSGDRTRLAAAIHLRGSWREAHGDSVRALEDYERAAEIYRETGDRGGLAAATSAVAGVHIARGDLQKALAITERMLALAQESRDEGSAARIRADLCSLRAQQGDFARAIEEADLAIPVLRRRGERGLEGVALARRGAALRGSGRLSEALADLETAGRMAEEAGDALTATGAQAAIGAIRLERGEYAEALAVLEPALKFAQNVADEVSEAATLQAIGAVHFRVGDVVSALEAFEGARSLHRRIGNRAGLAIDAANVAGVRMQMGETVAAIGAYGEALAVLEEVGDRSGAAATLMNLGTAWLRLGEYPRGLEALEQAATRQAAIGDRMRLAMTLTNLASAHAFLGDAAGARECLERAREAAEAIGNAVGVATAMGGIGGSLIAQGDPAGGLEAEERALTASTRAGDRAGQSAALVNMGVALEVLGRYPEAVERLGRARALKAELKDREGLALVDSNLGSVHARMGDVASALDALERALAAGEEIDSRRIVFHALWTLSSAHLSRGAPREAVAAARRAVAEMSGLVKGLGEEQGASARGQYADVFGVGARAAAALSDAENVTFFLESGRAGTLLESLGGRDALRAAALPQALRDLEAAAHGDENRARAYYLAARAKGDVSETRTRRAALTAAKSASVAAVERIQREAKWAASVLYPTAAPLERIRATVAPEEALVLYGMFEGEALALVVRREEARIVRLGLPAPVEEAVERLAIGTVSEDTTPALAALKALVVRPLDLDVGVKRVLVSPDGALSYVPFALLLDGREVACVPSGTTYGLLREERDERGEGVLALGDPDYAAKADLRATAVLRGPGALTPLPSTRDEAKAVGDVVLLGADATEAGVREAVSRRRRWHAIHFACHGLIDPERPLLSSLAVTPGGSDDGFLTALEVYRTTLPADLVVLSACETGKGKVVRGEGIVGMARAFMFAGAPRVLCSLWKVDDDATQALMTRFYALWNPKDGSTPMGTAAALRAAQAHVRDLEVESVDEAASQAAGRLVRRRTRPWSHPHYWAAWVLWGLPD